MKVWTAWRMMKAEGCQFLAVEENNNIIGTLCHRDLQLASSLPGNERTEVFDVMEMDFLSVLKGDSVIDVIELLKKTNSYCAHVVDKTELVGFFSYLEGLSYLMELNQLSPHNVAQAL